jgi:hypothetical protein
MKSKSKAGRINHLFRFLVRRLLLIGLTLSFALLARSQETKLTAISNRKGAPSSLKFSELKSIFMGEKQRWPNGTKITIALMKTNNPVGNSICRKIYDMTGDELNKFWLALVFQGKASAPNFFNYVTELESFIAQNPGSIGIIDQSAPNSEIKTVIIDGKKIF